MSASPDTVFEWTVRRDGSVGTIVFGAVDVPRERSLDHHMSFARSLESMRFDDSIRVVVIAGRDHVDEPFESGSSKDPAKPLPPQILDPSVRPGGSGSLRGPWNLTQGLERAAQTLAFMEKPVVGKVKGDASAFALHTLWGCDVVVAREDAIMCDTHLSMSPALPFGKTSGDGALGFLPLFLAPTKLKQLLMLGERWTARQMADLGLVNYALPGDEVDAKVDLIVADFLSRPPAALIRSKRAANKALIRHMNLALDQARLSQQTDLWEIQGTGFRQNMTLRPDEPRYVVSGAGPDQHEGA